MYLYGGRNQGALVQLALNLRQRYPGVRIVGGYSPPHRPLTAEEHEAVVKEINGSRADVVWAGIGVPKQEKWMAQMRDELQTPVLIGVGAAFDFHAGLVPQAPELAPGVRSGVGLPPCPRATSPVAALHALQPALRRRVRAAAARASPRFRRLIAAPPGGPGHNPHGVPAMPTATIVIPTRSRPAYLDVALAAIAPQAREAGAEVLVVNDGGDASTAQVAARHGAGVLELAWPRGRQRRPQRRHRRRPQ